jgi:hypothetical protein
MPRAEHRAIARPSTVSLSCDVSALTGLLRE